MGRKKKLQNDSKSKSSREEFAMDGELVEGNTEALLKLITPQLASELNDRRSSPLHLASLMGYAGIVRKLLEVNPDMCLAQDKDGMNPLHVAAMMGRIDVLKEMLRAKPEAACDLVNQSRTILHLCVEYSQFKALKLLVETLDFQDLVDLVHKRDKNGNTSLHLAIASGNVKMTEVLLPIVHGIKVNALNLNAMAGIGELINLKAFNQAINEKSIKSKDGWLDKTKITKMVVAMVVVVALFLVVGAFRVGVPNPMDEVWKNDLTIIYAHFPKGLFYVVIASTVIIASLSIICLVKPIGPILKYRVFKWILISLIIWIVVITIALTYTASILTINPYPVIAFICLICLLLIAPVLCFLMSVFLLGCMFRWLFNTVLRFSCWLLKVRKKET